MVQQHTSFLIVCLTVQLYNSVIIINPFKKISSISDWVKANLLTTWFIVISIVKEECDTVKCTEKKSQDKQPVLESSSLTKPPEEGADRYHTKPFPTFCTLFLLSAGVVFTSRNMFIFPQISEVKELDCSSKYTPNYSFIHLKKRILPLFNQAKMSTLQLTTTHTV